MLKLINRLYFFAKGRKLRAIGELIEESKVDDGYVLMLVISSSIITIGLVVGQISIVIGGMLIAPLLFPILALGLSLATLNFSGARRSFLGVLVSTVIVISTAYLTANFLEGAEFRGYELMISLKPSLLSFLIAFLSGVAASYSWVKSKQTVILPGVAIAVALVPPLCSGGIALAILNKPLFVDFLFVYTINLLGVLVSSVVVFLFSGLPSLKAFEEKVLEEETKVE